MSGIYIHIPFCKKACSYCDFHFSTSLNEKTNVLNAILKEITLRKRYLLTNQLDSIYFGGGTPSILSAQDLGLIINHLSKYFFWQKKIEITLEANPDDISPLKLKQWTSLGINRLSIGIQSFNDEELKWMNRAHNSSESVSSVKNAQDLGFDNISIDLIYGSKFQTIKSWDLTLQQAISLNTQHISSYNLTIEKSTALGLKNNRGLEPSVCDDLSSQQFLLLSKKLGQADFIQYEISNFGKKDFFAVHNTNYWLQKNYMGIGPSAHSFNGFSRQWNLKNNLLYVKALNNNTDFFVLENLSLKNRYNEYVLTRLRTIWGCNEIEINQLFGLDILAHFKKVATEKKEFFEIKKNIYTLNKLGQLQADGIASDLFLL